MKRSVTYTDAGGRPHQTAEAATVSDIAGLFINEKTPAGAASGIAAIVFARRKDIERIWAEHDDAVND